MLSVSCFFSLRLRIQLRRRVITQRPGRSMRRRKRGKLHRCPLGNKPSSHRCLRVAQLGTSAKVGTPCCGVAVRVAADGTSLTRTSQPFLRRWTRRGQRRALSLPTKMAAVSSCAPFDTARTTNQVRQRWRERRGLNPARVIRSGARKRGCQPLFSGQSGFHGWRVKAVRRSWPRTVR